MGKLDSMESKPPLQPPQRPAAAVGAGTGAGAGAGRGGSSNVIVNGNNNNGGELTLKAAAPERIKRDEWSEGAVTTLLDAYESKWLLRNRAKLKGNDWEEVARHVSTRGEGGKSAKTQTQCKNKIESMKKRYRSESASNNNNGSNNGNVSAWPLYARMDNLLRCRTAPLTTPAQPPDLELQEPPPPLMLPPPPPQPPPPPPPQENGHHRVEAEEEPAAEAEADEEEAERQETAAGAGAGPAAGAGAGVERSNQEDGSNTLPNRRESAALDTDTSTPRSKIANDPVVKEIAANFNFSCKRRKMSSPGGGGGGSEVAESIRSFADTIVKLEQAKMRMYKDSERLRAETEVRRGEMELKRTEIIANTQLQIAKLLSGKNGKRKLADRNSALALPEAAAHPPPHPLLHD